MNPGPGAYAAYIVTGDTEVWVTGRCSWTTNNRMELMAALRALEATPKNSAITVHSDAKYLTNAFNLGWMKGWEKKGWTKKGGLVNADLWIILNKLNNERSVTWNWVKGHDGHFENELCDAMVQKAKKTANRDFLGEKSLDEPEASLFTEKKPVDHICPMCKRPLDAKLDTERQGLL